MIDFKEKLHNDVNEILNESIVIDEGIGSALASGGKMFGKGLVKGGQLAASGAKSLKNKYKDYKINQSTKYQERLVNKVTMESIKDISEQLNEMEKGIKTLQKTTDLQMANDLVLKIKNASKAITEMSTETLAYYAPILKTLEKKQDRKRQDKIIRF